MTAKDDNTILNRKRFRDTSVVSGVMQLGEARAVIPIIQGEEDE